MLNLHFPQRQVKSSRKAVAQVFTPEGLKIFYIKIIYTKFFLLKGYGIFEIDQSKGVRYGKTVVYFFDARSAKPINPLILDELTKFTENNKLTKISRKDVRHSQTLIQKMATGLDRFQALDAIKDEFSRKQKRIDDQVNEIQKGSEAIDDDPLPEKDQGFILIDALIRANLISKEESDDLMDDFANDLLSFHSLVDILKKIDAVEIHTPMSTDAAMFLDDFHTYSPADVDTFIDRAEMLGGKMRKMGSTEVKNYTSAALIFAVIVGGAIALMVLSSSDMTNILPNLGINTPEEVEPIIPDIPLLDSLPGITVPQETTVEVLPSNSTGPVSIVEENP